jgi:hypothetical protein
MSTLRLEIRSSQAGERALMGRVIEINKTRKSKGRFARTPLQSFCSLELIARLDGVTDIARGAACASDKSRKKAKNPAKAGFGC